jgi:hypothetical protein
MDIDSFISSIEKENYEDENGRYKSWEHCYKYFKENRGRVDESIVDLMSLQLAVYLASWGMYRGKSFLLQKDYKIHHDAVREILKVEYNPLWNVKCIDLLNNSRLLDLVFVFKNKIEEIYKAKIKNLKGTHNVTDTLITKIMMGTFGCVPAYDQFFTDGIKIEQIASQTFSPESITKLAEFYKKNFDRFEDCRKKISKNGLEYPQMKLIDMGFWQIGYDNNEKAPKKTS